MQTKKKRVMITVTPLLYERAKKLNEPFSQVVEEALSKLFAEKKKKTIEENLLKRALDPECRKDDLEIINDFFPVEL